MQPIWIVDIDGTLADNSHRSPYDESKVLKDKTLPTCEVIRSLIKTGHKIIYFSGRTDGCYEDTKLWLQLACDENPELYMRKSGDTRSDEIIKSELYLEHIFGKYEVLGVFDDRLRVCRMWYELGLFVLNCNQGLREF